MTVSNNVIKIRNMLGISQQELAKLLKCSQSTISGLENDFRQPSYSLIIKLNNLAKSHKIKVSFL